jgi:serine/threonine protein kinase/TolB-like protein
MSADSREGPPPLAGEARRASWTRVRQVFEAALAQPAERRPLFVAESCRDDPAIHDQVRALLASHAHAAEFLERPAIRALGDASSATARGEGVDSNAGRMIGPYCIESCIGRGGMGSVYLARRADLAFERRVAIKMIRPGMDSDVIIRRFQHERQILASLDHPHIARLFDGGSTPDGLPYFVMEYVEGTPIDRYADARRLDTKARIELCLGVLDAVQHAHERGIVHRDLKPSNVLVTASGSPKLLDFGIAKILDPEAQGASTLTILARAMTPDYASPEQVRGEPVTPATDVYAVGLLLYELLTGHRPYRLGSRTPHEIARVICEQDPLKPSAVVDQMDIIAVPDATGTATNQEAISRRRDGSPELLRRRLAGALDAIVLKALRKEPSERYSTAAALADDLQCYLDDRPVSAARDAVRYRVARAVRRHRAAAGVAALMVLASAVTALLIRQAPREAPPQVASIRSIAVLPFSNSSGTADLDYLSEGITEDLIQRVSLASRVKVIARDSVYRYRGRDKNPRDIGRELGVEAVLTGRVTRRGSNLSLSAELVDARDGRHLWGEHYDRKLSDLQLLQRQLAQRIIASLHVQLSLEERTRLGLDHTDDAAAYHAYLRGRYLWNKRTPDGLQKSIGHFQQAVDADPAFALAYSGLADAHTLLTEYYVAPAAATYPHAREAATRALAIDDSSAEAHTSMAYIRMSYEWDWEGAEAEFQRAIQLNPTYPTAHQWYAEYLSSRGRHDEAVAEIRKAKELEPLSPIIHSVEAIILYQARRYDQVIELCQRVIDLYPDFPEVYEYLKRGYQAKGMYKEAMAARQTRQRILGRSTRQPEALRAAGSVIDPIVYWRGRLEQGLEEASAAGSGPFELAFELAELLAQVGQNGPALRWLEQACAQSDFNLKYLRTAPLLDPLRDDPGYKDLLQRRCAVTR